MAKIRFALLRAAELLSSPSLLEFVSVWSLWVIWWQGDAVRDILGETEACYLQYILLKSDVYTERWTDCWSFSCSVLLFKKCSFRCLWFSSRGAVMKAGKVHWVSDDQWRGAWDFRSALVQ